MKKVPLFISTIFVILCFSSSFAQTRGNALPADTKTIKIASGATAFQDLHRDATALKSKQKNYLKVGDFFCIDLQITSLTQRWDAQLSDIDVIHLVDEQNFEGNKIATGMPSLNTWKFVAKKAGKCSMYFVLPSFSGVKEDEQIILYEIEVLEK